MRAILIAAVLMSAGAWGQQHPKPDTAVLSGQVSPWILSVGPAPPQQPPLQCGKYQHVEHWPDDQCGPTPCSGSVCVSICAAPPPDKCVDDIHTVTEREWQELLARIKQLESANAVKP